jgi:peptidoglycan/xylan/chitin deacetylase (PgdA/CDA1 family)
MTRTRSGLPRGRAKLMTVGLAVAALSAALLTPGVANAAVDNPAPQPLVSFTFDDGMTSAIDQAAPTLKKYGLTGTSYVITGCVGMTAVPNTCRAGTDVPYMTWAQVNQLKNTYGWEIGSHTVDHQCLVSVGGDCQATKLTTAQVDAELANSKAALAAQGIDATAFAAPYGDYDMSTVAQVAKYYSSMRGFADVGNNVWPLGDYLLHNVPVQEVTTPVAALKAKVDDAITNKKWVVFTFHDIMPNPSQTPDDYQYGTAELDQLAAYVQTKVAAGAIKNVNVSKGLVTGTPNLMPNPTFNNGLGDGWSTDAPATITADAGNNGSFPDPARSVKLVSNNAAPTIASHLFSPKVAVKPATNYLFKAFLNVAAITTGDVSFYVDEYDAAGSWLSGQFKKVENSRWVEAMNFSYTPTSANVASASLQVAVRGTDVTAYVDNVQMLAPGYMPPTVSPFADVSTSQQFYKEMSWLKFKEISTGWTEANGTVTYRPLQSINRDAMAAFLYRAAGQPAFTPPAVSPFADVSTGQQFYKEMAWLKAQEISTGWTEPNGTVTYRPLQAISRDAMAAFLYRAAGKPAFAAPAVSPFADVSTGQQFYLEMAWLAKAGISTGWTEPNGAVTYRPFEAINRDAMAAFLYRMYNPTDS